MSTNYHKKTILQVLPSLISGGVERGTIDVAKYLVKNNYKSLVTSSGGILVDQLLSTGSIHFTMNAKSKNPFIILYNHIILSNIINHNKVDIVHARSRAPAFSAYLAAYRTKAKFITTFHGIYDSSTLPKKIYNSIMTKGDRVIVVSNFVKDHIIENYKVPEDKIRVIYRGVDLDYFNPQKIELNKLLKYKEEYNIPKDVRVILLPARMTSWKGQDIVIEALNMIKECNFYCIMVGDMSSHPNFTNMVKKKIINYKLQSKIQLCGPVTDISILYALSDIVLSASTKPEAFGRTIVEAKAMKNIVIATKIGGAIETITDEVNGFHVKVNDAQNLAEKIKYVLLYLDSQKIQSIRNNARQSVIDYFSLQQMLSKTLDVYNELI